MRTRLILCVLMALIAVSRSSAQTPVSTAFTYQGLMKDAGTTADGLYDLRFRLFNAASGGEQVGATLCIDGVEVVDGLFTVQLDFGQQFATTSQRHLEIHVRQDIGQPCTDDFGYILLSPRQQLTATPLASHSNSAFALDAADGSPTNAVIVDAEGDVGVGTSTPDMLNYGSRVFSLGGARPRFEFQGSSSTSLNLGIIDFLNDNAGRAAIVVTADDATNSAHMNFDTKSVWLTGGNGGGLPNSAGAGLRLYFDGTRGNIFSFNYATATARDLALQEPGGNVGIGTTTPTNKLSVTGNANFTGNVGIGTSVPATKLHVDGKVRADVAFDSSDNLEIRNHNGVLIWTMGVHPDVAGAPLFSLVSPFTGDLMAGFWRNPESGNGVVFADYKAFRAPNPADPTTDIWYSCLEGPEAAMYVRGTARLTNGRATIVLPDHFRSLASEPGMTVQLTPLSLESRGLAVVKKQLDGIEVGELGGGSGDYEFDWRVEAVRKGYENYEVIRPWIKSDPDTSKAWENRMRWIAERRDKGMP